MATMENKWNIREVLAQLPKKEILPPEEPPLQPVVGRGLPEIRYQVARLTYGEMMELVGALLEIKGDAELTDRCFANILHQWATR